MNIFGFEIISTSRRERLERKASSSLMTDYVFVKDWMGTWLRYAELSTERQLALVEALFAAKAQETSVFREAVTALARMQFLGFAAAKLLLENLDKHYPERGSWGAAHYMAMNNEIPDVLRLVYEEYTGGKTDFCIIGRMYGRSPLPDDIKKELKLNEDFMAAVGRVEASWGFSEAPYDLRIEAIDEADQRARREVRERRKAEEILA